MDRLVVVPLCRRGALALVLLLAAARPAVAEISEEAKAQARLHYSKGKAAFELGRFKEALKEYSQAYKLAPLAGFLFNIGQCHRNLDNHEKAIFSFRLYLKKMPDARNRSAVETLLEELEQKAEEERQRQLDQQATTVPTYAPTPPPITDPPPVRPPPPPPFYTQWWFWVPVSAVVISGAAVGGYYAFRARDPELPPSDLGVWNISH